MKVTEEPIYDQSFKLWSLITCTIGLRHDLSPK